MREGLYVTLTPEGIIKKHLSTKTGEVPLDNISIADELIQFSEKETPFRTVDEQSRWLWDKMQEIDYDPTIYKEFQNALTIHLSQMISRDIEHTVLTRTMIEDSISLFPRDAAQEKENVFIALTCMAGVNTAQLHVNYILSSLCLGKKIPARLMSALLGHTYVTITFTLEKELQSQYLFRSEADYYMFLLQHFFASKPNIARCKYCGRIFVPKTRKKTKYCDRVVLDGKTCKQIAPHLNRKERTAADKVVSEYNRVKDMLVHRLERTQYDKKASPIDLTREEYYLWQDAATAARDRYLAGELSEQEAWKIIHVPTIQEQKQRGLVTAT